MQRLGFVRFHQVIVQISNENYIVEMNMNFINTRSKIVNKTSIRHWMKVADRRRQSPICGHKPLFQL